MITIRLDEQTSHHLSQGRYSLYAFRAVDLISAAARPTVWCRVTYPLLQEIQLTWDTSLSAFISTSEVSAGTIVHAGYSTDITLGDSLRIEAAGQTVVREDSPDAITFDNRSPSHWTCGIAQTVNGHREPLCAFPLPPQTQQGIRPADAILALFSTADMATGTVVTDPQPDMLRKIGGGGYTAFANQTQGILVTDTTKPATLTYSHDSGGWTWDGVSATRVKPSEPIVPLLIRSS